MKKFIVLAVAALSMNAFAAKHMVSLYGYEGGNTTDRSLDFTNSAGGEYNTVNDRVETRNLALNYAYAINDTYQVGAVYKNYNKQTNGDIGAAGDKSTTMGLYAIYNFAGQLSDTNYLALGYSVYNAEDSDAGAATVEDDVKTNTWSVDFGHRFSMGTVWGMNFNYSPSASVQVSKTTHGDDAKDDLSSTSLTLNFVKFDVLF